MPASFSYAPHSCLRKQRGAALMVMLVIFIVGSLALMASSLSRTGLQIERDKITSDALSQAKEALIGRAVADANYPGGLLCPDTNDDGTAESLVGNNCPSYIGRLPWKSLKLPDLRDQAGERLWYALSPNFRKDNSNPINSNNQGTLLVYDNSGITLLTPPGSEGVAIIFAPGTIVASQQRDSLANQISASNYLDIGPNSVNNSTAIGPFIAADKSSSFNDRLMIIKTRDLIPLVEKRVAKELQSTFSNYISSNPGQYPNPAIINCSTSGNCTYDTTQCRGWIPVTAPDNPHWILPNWFVPNGWYRVIYYSAGSSRLGSTPPGCNLTVSLSTTPALFFMTGSPLNSNLNDTYIQPGSTATSNDSLYVLP
jgi:type II secretory pathway pseudopilin PulG